MWRLYMSCALPGKGKREDIGRGGCCVEHGERGGPVFPGCKHPATGKWTWLIEFFVITPYRGIGPERLPGRRDLPSHGSLPAEQDVGGRVTRGNRRVLDQPVSYRLRGKDAFRNRIEIGLCFPGIGRHRRLQYRDENALCRCYARSGAISKSAARSQPLDHSAG